MKAEDFEKWQADHWSRNSDPYHNSLFYLSSCAMGEAGEAFKIVKAASKLQCVSDPKLTSEERQKLIYEIGDQIHYALRLLHNIDCTLEEALVKNQAKLMHRYGEDS